MTNEIIMITAPTDMTSFSMQVACGSLTPTLNDDNSVDFLDNDGNIVYHVSIPYRNGNFRVECTESRA